MADAKPEGRVKRDRKQTAFFQPVKAQVEEEFVIQEVNLTPIACLL